MRFQPDSPLEFLLRPVAMAAPDANVYVELMAPDLRFVFVLILLVLLPLLSALRRRRWAEVPGPDDRAAARPVRVLLLVLVTAFVAWLATTANGRYFVVGLLIIGPVCLGLAKRLPVTRGLRLTLAVLMVGVQGFVVQQSDPFRAWALTTWNEAPYFHLEVPPEWRAEPATFVTMSAISYSLVAPLFHPQSRWMSLHNASASYAGAQDVLRTEAFLSKAQMDRLLLLAPVVPGMLTEDKLPNAKLSEAIDLQLSPFRLRLAQPRACRFLSSQGLAGIGLGAKSELERARTGFWLCHLKRMEGEATPARPAGKRYDAVFKTLEALCPRFFPAGGDGTSLKLSNGESRSYLQAEMKAYVYDNGEVYYKYYRALNPVLVGSAADLLAGKARLDCGRIRGRSGLPWDREI